MTTSHTTNEWQCSDCSYRTKIHFVKQCWKLWYRITDYFSLMFRTNTRTLPHDGCHKIMCLFVVLTILNSPLMVAKSYTTKTNWLNYNIRCITVVKRLPRDGLCFIFEKNWHRIFRQWRLMLENVLYSTANPLFRNFTKLIYDFSNFTKCMTRTD